MVLTALTSAVRNEEQLNETQLEFFIKEMAKGNKTALSSFYEQTRVAIYGFSMSILKNTYDAEDVLQNTYIKIYNCAENYTPLGKPMAWVFTIVRNLSLMKIREYQKTVNIPEDEWENSYIQNENSSFQTEDKVLLETVMQNLSDIERQIIILHAVSGFKHREIADVLNLPISTVLSKYHRAIKRLKTLLEEYA